MREGYSLIELMVVMSLFTLLILVSTQTLFLSIKQTTKSEALNKVNENVEHVVSVMERQIRNAKSIVQCPNTNTSTISYITSSGVQSSFSCVNTGTDGYITSDSSILTDSSISIVSCTITCQLNTAAPPSVTFNIEAQSKSATLGAEKARATSKTTVLLRQY